MCLSLLALDFADIWAARDARLREATTETDNLARSLAQHAQDVFETAADNLKTLGESIETQGTGAAFIARLNSSTRERLADQDIFQRIFAFDEHGHWLVSTLDPVETAMTRPLNETDQELFRFHLDNADRGLRIGRPVRTRLHNIWVVTLSRRISHADGSFAGVVGASVKLDLFQHFFDTFDIGRRGAITLITGLGTILVHRPLDEATVGLNIATTEVFGRTTQDGRGSFEYASPIDGRPRLETFDKVPGYDLTIIVALDKGEVLAIWRRETWIHVAWLAITVLVIALLGNRLSLQIRNRSMAEAALAESRMLLESRVVDRTAELRSMVTQRDVLLREVYHRVANNLQFIDSLIDMESRRMADGPTRERMAKLIDRIFTFGLVHNQLMSSDNLKAFPLLPLLLEISDHIQQCVGAMANGVEFIMEVDPVSVDLDFAVPLAMLATELLTNAYQHAHARTITLAFRACPDDRALLFVNDDGDDAEAGLSHMGLRPGLGAKLIAGFVGQLEGHMETFHAGGTRIEVSMPFRMAA